MQLRILGSAAGGGSPQWNCWCAVCRAVRGGEPGTQRRMQSSIAVREAPGAPWLLVNASPDLHRQLDLLDTQVGDEVVRANPVGGVLLTDAEIDHASGLLLLREADEPLELYATDRAVRALREDWPLLRMLESWCGIDWHELTADDPRATSRFGEITIEAFTSGEDAPRYT